MAIRNITIIGTGLIGGSLGLALKEHGIGHAEKHHHRDYDDLDEAPD